MSQTMLIMLAALGAELFLLLLVLLSVSWFSNRGARQRDAKAATALIARVKKEKPERAAAIEKFLNAGMGMEGEVLEQAKTAMLRGELVLLQRFAGIYKKRDAAAAARFDGDLVAAIEPYHALTGQGGGTEAAVDGEPVDDRELEALRKENQRLSDELKITMETMSRMLNEYSTMFGGGEAAAAAPISSVVAGAAAGVASAAEAVPGAGEQDADDSLSSPEDASLNETTADDEASSLDEDAMEIVAPGADDAMEIVAPGADDAVMLDTRGGTSDNETPADELADLDELPATPETSTDTAPVDDDDDVAVERQDPATSTIDTDGVDPDDSVDVFEEGEIDIVSIEEGSVEREAAVVADLDSDLFDIPDDGGGKNVEVTSASDTETGAAVERPSAIADEELFDASVDDEPKPNNAGG